MATAAARAMPEGRGDDGFFLWIALAMTLVIVAGFSMQLAAGRSSFASPLIIHVHAFVYFGWVVIFLAQTVFATRGSIALHRRLGWVSLGWLAAMVVLGFAIIMFKIQSANAPFFFQPQHFLIANPLVVMLFAGLTLAAVAQRRHTGWHRRLHVCGMAALSAVGFGRLLPMPLLIPFAYQAAALAALVFPVAGMIYDKRRDGRVHPAWWWGVGATLAAMIGTELIVYGPLGDAIYRTVTAGTPGADVDPLGFATPPGM